MALITLSRATELVPNFQSADDSVMTDCINAASDVIVRYCNNQFVLQTYDDVCDGTGDCNLLLPSYPVTQIIRVAFNKIQVLSIRNTNNNIARATCRLDGDTNQPPNPNNVYLVSVLNGIETDITIGPLTSPTPTVTINGTPTNISQMHTLNDLATVINTYGVSYGWAAVALGVYATYPIQDLRPPQGAFDTRWQGNAYLELHAWNMLQYEQKPWLGEIVSAQGFDRGYANYRVIYQAGYSTIPYSVQQACAALAVSVYNARNINANLASENLGGYSYSVQAERSFNQLDIATKYGLALYKNRRVAKYRVG